MTDQNCAYCMEGDLVAQFGIKICELPSSKVYLFKEQSHKGRVIVAHKKHVSEIVELTAEERAAYMEDINHVAEALHKAFHPQKINYGAYGDTGHHLHFHLVPKYVGSSSSSSSSTYSTCPICHGSGVCTSCGGRGGEWRDTGYYTGSGSKSWIDCPSCNGKKTCFNCFGTGRI